MIFKTVTICGSMRFYQRMLREAERLTTEGYIVLMPFTIAESESVTKTMLDNMHLMKIRMSNEILVVNYDPAIQSNAYVGPSTSREIAYAIDRGMKVTYVKRMGE